MYLTAGMIVVILSPGTDSREWQSEAAEEGLSREEWQAAREMRDQR